MSACPMRAEAAAAAAAVDDACSFAARFERLLPVAHNVGQRFFPGDEALAADVAQEALTRAYIAWGRLCSHPNVEAWIVTTAVHVALEFLRKRRRAAAVDSCADVEEQEGEQQRVLDEELLRDAMHLLSRRQQHVLIWRFYFDQTVRDTAERMGLTDAKVKDSTHDAIVKLRRLLPAT